MSATLNARHAAAERQQPARDDSEDRPWYRSTWAVAVAGSLIMWLALPPVDWGWLAWVAPIPWLLLIREKRLDARRPYLVFYVAGFAYWAAAVYWVMLPHWSAKIGWVALAVYLAFYVLFFIGLSRVAVHHLRVPLVIAAPVVWTGLELVRAYLFSGFLLAALGHTQYRFGTIIQISDLVGGYGVSFLVMFVAACLARAVPGPGSRVAIWPLPLAACAFAAAYAYGHFRTAGETPRDGPQVLLIQGSIDTQFGLDPVEHRRDIYNEYLSLTKQALARAKEENRTFDAIIWPESMYRSPLATVEDGAYVSADKYRRWLDLNEAQAREHEKASPRVLKKLARDTRNLLRYTVMAVGDEMRALGLPVQGSGPQMILGVSAESYGPDTTNCYNTSVCLDRDGEIQERYDKMHLVIFGEYIPLGGYVPSLYELSPLVNGLTAGTNPVVYDIAGAKVSPSICYESVLPHVIRRQVNVLRDSGREPDLLITQTNDGWFWGSAGLDMHLICGVFRAVECRKPLLIAANTGISASIDANGRIVERGPKRERAIIFADTWLDDRESLYLQGGDWFAHLCAAACGLLLLAGCWSRCKKPPATPAE